MFLVCLSVKKCQSITLALRLHLNLMAVMILVDDDDDDDDMLLIIRFKHTPKASKPVEQYCTKCSVRGHIIEIFV